MKSMNENNEEIVPVKQKIESEQLIVKASGMKIVTEDDYNAAVGIIRDLDTMIKYIKDCFAEPEKKQKEALKALQELKNNQLSPLVLARSGLSPLISKFDTERERKEIERSLEQIPKARVAFDEECLRSIEIAEEAGDHDLAEKLLQEASNVQIPVIHSPKISVAKGFCRKTHYKANIVNPHEAALYIGQNRIGDPDALKKALAPFIGPLARSLKRSLKIPGVQIIEERTTVPTGR